MKVTAHERICRIGKFYPQALCGFIYFCPKVRQIGSCRPGYCSGNHHPLLENQEKYNTIESIENFLFVSVKNEALNYLRGIERENNRYARLENPESEEPQIFNLFIEEETNQMLLTAIGQLPEQSARIIRLALSGLENKEISRLLDVSVNTVKTLKYSAIRKLREHFQKKAI